MTGRMIEVGLPPAECTVQPAWKVASPAATAPWVSFGSPRSAITRAKVASDSSLIDSPHRSPSL